MAKVPTIQPENNSALQYLPLLHAFLKPSLLYTVFFFFTIFFHCHNFQFHCFHLFSLIVSKTAYLIHRRTTHCLKVTGFMAKIYKNIRPFIRALFVIVIPQSLKFFISFRSSISFSAKNRTISPLAIFAFVPFTTTLFSCKSPKIHVINDIFLSRYRLYGNSVFF